MRRAGEELKAFILANPTMRPPAVAAACGVVVGTVYNLRKELRRSGAELPPLGKGGRRPYADVPGGVNATEIRLLVGDATMRTLRREAEVRGEPVDGLMSRLLDVVAADRMVAAVLDDEVSA